MSREEQEAVYDLLAVYHFQLQATIIEIYGPDCVDDAFLDNQLDWLLRWRAQWDARRGQRTENEEKQVHS